jgi:hypothetical protein
MPKIVRSILLFYVFLFATWSSATAFAADNTAEARCGDAKVIKVTCPPYNAVPDDKTDDSKAFQAAVDKLPSSGGTIVIPKGTYLFAKPFLIQKPVHLVGAGPASILTHDADLGTNGQANLIRIGGAAGVTANLTLEGFALKGPKGKDLRTTMIRIVSDVKNLRIRNLFFKDVSSTCILIFGNHIQDVDITDNRADEFYEQFVEFASGNTSNVRIERNVIRSTRGHPKLGSTQPFGVAFEPKADGEIADVVIVGNQISFDGMNKSELVNTGGIQLSTGPAKTYLYRHISIQDNVIRAVGVGIRVQTLGQHSVEQGSVKIAGNRIEGAKSYGIEVSAASSGPQHSDAVSIIENTIQGYSGQAYYRYDGIRLEGSAVGPEIRGNKILPPAGSEAGYGRYGISIGSGIRNAVVKDNKIAGYRDGAILNKSIKENIGS